MGCKISLAATQTSVRQCGQILEFYIFVTRNAAPCRVPPFAPPLQKYSFVNLLQTIKELITIFASY